MTTIVRISRLARLALGLTLGALLFSALPAQAAPANRLLRIRITPHAGFSRVTLLFQEAPDYSLAQLTGRLKLRIRDTDSPPFRRYRSYADPHLNGIFLAQHGPTLQVTLGLKPGAVAQLSSFANPQAISFDVAPAAKKPTVAIVPGREPILKGTEKLVREFGIPGRSGLPFTPTDPKLLAKALSEPQLLLFQRGEGLLYREQGSEAVEIFRYFQEKIPALRPLSCYRLGEAYYLMERYDDALKAFCEGERLDPGYLERADEIMEAYADTRARTGDFTGGRGMLSRLIGRLAGTPYAAPLLNHLADLSARHGDDAAALATFRTVLERFPGSSAAARARMKLADREMFTLGTESFRALQLRYQTIYDQPGDATLRDEALFKVALLEALYGPAPEALAAAVSYEKRYPRGFFATIVKQMHAELLLPVYRELVGNKEELKAQTDRKLVQLALDHKEHLSVCLADPGFARRLADACAGADLLSAEITLFTYLADRSWAGEAAPYLLARVVEDGRTLGKLSVAEEAGKNFLSRYPARPGGQRIQEQLGGMAWERGSRKEVLSYLSFLNRPRVKAEIPESNYYLGKALAAQGEHRDAARALARFVAGGSAGSPLLADAYFSLAGARASLKEHQGALAACRQGLQLATGVMADQFRYEMGELYLAQRQVREARAVWERLAKEGSDPAWRRMASERVEDLAWRLKISRELPAGSKD